jgi:hypothetical protein
MKRADESVGGVPVEIEARRKETVVLEMEGSVRLIERALEDKAIQVVKQALNEYCETLVAPWLTYNALLTVSTKEIVEAMHVQGWPLAQLIGQSGLLSWRYTHQWSAELGHTAEQWSHILDHPIDAPSFINAVRMWQDEVSE